MPAQSHLIQVRRGSSSEWMLINPILSIGELGFEIDTNKLKIGNGSDTWNNLKYIGSSENVLEVKNNTGYAINKGQAVYISGYDSVSNLPYVGLYIANNTLNEKKFLGLSSSYIPNGSSGYVILFGVLSGIDTTGNISNLAIGNESWSNGDILYVNRYDYGKLTNVKPKYNIILVGLILYSNINGSILTRPFINPKLKELNGIDIDNEKNTDLLKYDSSSSMWTNSGSIDGGTI